MTIRWSQLSATAQDAIGTGGFVVATEQVTLATSSNLLVYSNNKNMPNIVIGPTFFVLVWTTK